MYVEAADNCNTLSFNLANEYAEREWKMIARQYDCEFENKAPKGMMLPYLK